MKVVILAGGYGTRFGKLTEVLPKPMMPIGPHPMLWHIMKIYAHYGYNDFIICLGYKAELIKSYFLNFDAINNDFTMDFSASATERLAIRRGALSRTENWKVTLAYTGLETMTGGRVKRIAEYIDDDDFMLTYGDGVADVDIRSLVAFHRSHGKIATLTASLPPPKFGDLTLKESVVTDFAEKKYRKESHINGGFYVFKRELFDYLENDSTCVLERSPLERLSEEGNLMAFRHDGFWQCMDTTRDMELLNRAWSGREAPWKVWDGDYDD